MTRGQGRRGDAGPAERDPRRAEAGLRVTSARRRCTRKWAGRGLWKGSLACSPGFSGDSGVITVQILPLAVVRTRHPASARLLSFSFRRRLGLESFRWAGRRGCLPGKPGILPFMPACSEQLRAFASAPRSPRPAPRADGLLTRHVSLRRQQVGGAVSSATAMRSPTGLPRGYASRSDAETQDMRIKQPMSSRKDDDMTANCGPLTSLPTAGAIQCHTVRAHVLHRSTCALAPFGRPLAMPTVR